MRVDVTGTDNAGEGHIGEHFYRGSEVSRKKTDISGMDKVGKDVSGTGHIGERYNAARDISGMDISGKKA